jgi:hypothetical protein
MSSPAEKVQPIVKVSTRRGEDEGTKRGKDSPGWQTYRPEYGKRREGSLSKHQLKHRWSTVPEKVISIKKTGSASESNRENRLTQRSVKKSVELEDDCGETVINRIRIVQAEVQR